MARLAARPARRPSPPKKDGIKPKPSVGQGAPHGVPKPPHKDRGLRLGNHVLGTLESASQSPKKQGNKTPIARLGIDLKVWSQRPPPKRLGLRPRDNEVAILKSPKSQSPPKDRGLRPGSTRRCLSRSRAGPKAPQKAGIKTRILKIWRSEAAQSQSPPKDRD
jgi:hypothetical protein